MAPSARSSCDIAVVHQTGHDGPWVPALLEAKCDEPLYNNTLHDRLCSQPQQVQNADIGTLGPATQTVAYMGAVLLTSMRRQYDGPLTGAVINCVKKGQKAPAYAAQLLELRPPKSCFCPWEVHITQSVPYGETPQSPGIVSACAAAIVLRVLADGLERFRRTNVPNAPLPKPFLGPLAGTTLFASPLPSRIGQRSIRFGEIVLVDCADTVKVELSRLMDQEHTLFGQLGTIKEMQLIKLVSDTAVVPWTNTKDGFRSVWLVIEHVHLVSEVAQMQRDQCPRNTPPPKQLRVESAPRNEVQRSQLPPQEIFFAAFRDQSRDEGVLQFGLPSASAEPPSAASAAAGLQRACDTIGRVLVCAGVSRDGGGAFMVMHDVSNALAVKAEHVQAWSTFFDQIVEGFLLPLAVNKIVYFDLRPGCSKLRVTWDSQYLPLDLDSLVIFNSVYLTNNVGNNGRYPHHTACNHPLDFVYAQVLLVAFCASIALSHRAPGGGLLSCEDFFYRSAALVPWLCVAAPPKRQSAPPLQTAFDTWMREQKRVSKVAAPTRQKGALTEGGVRLLRNLSITGNVNIRM